MIFHIKQGATLPKLKLQLISGNVHSQSSFVECMKNAEIKFSMWDKSCGAKVVSCKTGRLEKVIDGCEDCTTEDYLLVIDWDNFDTIDTGTFIGEITVTFLDTGDVLKLPMHDELLIVIT